MFRRTADESFEDLSSLMEHCFHEHLDSRELWVPPNDIGLNDERGELTMRFGDDAYRLNDWSFSQLCGLCAVSKETANRLTSFTAAQVLHETLPKSSKPIQFFAAGDRIRSLHGTRYTRLYNGDVLSGVASDFRPPQRAGGDEENNPPKAGGTGLYCGEQEMFVFLIDPQGWIEIEGQNFAPGMFLWNSEVGKRSIGVQTFWFQAICANHIVWDAVEVVEYSRKHTANVGHALDDIERIVKAVAAKRDARKDAFASLLKRAMRESAGANAEAVAALLADAGIGKRLAQAAIDMAALKGRFTFFTLVDALTQLGKSHVNAAERVAADRKAVNLLRLLSEARPTYQV